MPFSWNPKQAQERKKIIMLKKYFFGINDEKGKLIEINIPAMDEDEAKDKLMKLIGFNNTNKCWLNDVASYDTTD